MSEITEKLKVFVSYSRDDLQFMEQLLLALKERGFEPLVDRYNIDAAEEWKTRLGELIFHCDTLVFVLSVHSVASPICTWEVEKAAQLGKRMIPVLPAPVEGVTPPPQLSDLNYVFFYSEQTIPGSGFYDGVIKLDHALRVNLAWLREATRLSEESAAWIASGRGEDRLLRGTALKEAQDWRVRAPANAEIQPDTLAYLAASTDAETRRKAESEAQIAERQRALVEREAAVVAEQAAVAEKVKAEQALRDAEIAAALDRERAAKRVAYRTRIGALAALVLAIVAGFASVYARLQAKEAQIQEQRAVREKTKAEEALARLLVERSWNLPPGEQELSMKYALAGYQFSAGNRHLVRASLARSVNEVLPTVEIFRASTQVRMLKKSPDGMAIIALTEDDSVESWLYSADKQEWERTRVVKDVIAASFSPDSSLAMFVGNIGTVLLVEAATGTDYRKLHRSSGKVTSAAFSSDGKRLVTALEDGSVRLWEPATGMEVAVLRHVSWVNITIFSKDATRLLTASADGTVRLWDAQTGTPIGRPIKHYAEVTLAVFSKDERRILTASVDGTARLWDAQTGALIGSPLLHKGPVTVDRFSRDGKRQLTIDSGGNFYIWGSNGGFPEHVFLSNRYGIDHGIFSNDGDNLIGVETSGKFIVWEAESGRVILETKIDDQKLKLLDVTGNEAIIGRSDGSVHLLDYSQALKSIEDLKNEACRHLEVTNNTNFDPFEVAADTLITDTWIAYAERRSLCDFE